MTPISWLEHRTQQAVVSVKALAGQTACSYAVALESGVQYVLRSQTERASRLGVNYQQEATVLDTIQPLGIAPSVIYSAPNGTILEWLEGSTPSEFSDRLVKALAENVAQLHRFGAEQVGKILLKIPQLNVAERCQFLWQQLPESVRHSFSVPPLPEITPFAERLCHLDLHLGNLIETPDKLMLIDWEYAALADPALDIAMCFKNNAFNAEQQAMFLAHYFARTQFDPVRFTQKMAEYAPVISALNQFWHGIAEHR